MTVSRRVTVYAVLAWPLLLSVLVLVRQARPFKIISDDASYYAIAQNAAGDAKAAYETNGLVGGFRAFAEACSVRGELPPHIPRKRPFLLWVWSGAYLLAGDQGLMWAWRVLYLVTIIALFLVLWRLSNHLVASLLAGVVAVAPATQGLLAWMACSTYLVSYPALLVGLLLLAHRRWPITAVGILFLAVGMASREVALLLVASAVAIQVYLTGRKRIAVVLPLLAGLLWFVLPIENRSTATLLGRDPSIFLRGAGLVVAAESAGIIRNLGLVFSVMVLLCVKPKWAPLSVALGLLSLVAPGVSLLVPVALLVFAGSVTRLGLGGILWVVISVASMCFYGNFASRYVFEPLVGMALLLAPALAPARGKRLLLLLPLVLWQSASCLFPNAVFSSRGIRYAGEVVDRRIAALDYVTRLRREEWETFAGRTPHEWQLVADMRLACSHGDGACGRVWRSKGYWRAGNPVSLHCDREDHLVFTRDEIWEWNVWYWRTVPARKGAGIHMRGKAGEWEVHPGPPPRDHARCFSIVTKPLRQRLVTPHAVVADWLADAPECMDRGAVRSWLFEVWSTEPGCPRRFSQSSFSELELGRLLVRDDGWLDIGELSYLRRHTRQVRGVH